MIPVRDSRLTHPANYILFPVPATPICDEEDEVFFSEIQGTCPPSLKYKQSCPALLGTASKRLERIAEDRQARATSESDEGMPPSSSPSNFEDSIVKYTNHSQVNGHALAKKRSFLLVDVLESVEGRRPVKRQDLHNTNEALPTGSDRMVSRYRSHRPSGGVKKQQCEFDIRYTSAQSQSTVSSKSTETPKQDCSSGSPTSLDFDVKQGVSRTDTAHDSDRGRSGRLRPAKSMISISLERARSTSPCKTRLDLIDTARITSFDTLLQTDLSCKGAILEPPVDQSTSTILRFESQQGVYKGRPDVASVDFGSTSRVDFSRNTELLKQIPPNIVPPARPRRLRHAKSAKDVLQKYVASKPDGDAPKVSTGPAASGIGEVGQRKEDKRRAKQVSLRDGLRNLLGLKKTANAGQP